MKQSSPEGTFTQRVPDSARTLVQGDLLLSTVNKTVPKLTRFSSFLKPNIKYMDQSRRDFLYSARTLVQGDLLLSTVNKTVPKLTRFSSFLKPNIKYMDQSRRDFHPKGTRFSPNFSSGQLPSLPFYASNATNTAPGSTLLPISALILATLPARGAAISFSIFIASTTTNTCPCVTSAPTSVLIATTVP